MSAAGRRRLGQNPVYNACSQPAGLAFPTLESPCWDEKSWCEKHGSLKATRFKMNGTDFRNI